MMKVLEKYQWGLTFVGYVLLDPTSDRDVILILIPSLNTVSLKHAISLFPFRVIMRKLSIFHLIGVLLLIRLFVSYLFFDLLWNNGNIHVNVCSC